ncbi:MAG: hypothetical protein Q8Q63_00685 [Phaeovulum sp.]|uniref:hypothetical protein n=1 Tax=Phaeovulum sp. TaxID=2934796 RepID=UPI002734BA61|nr:hypothetical protein [Phaeovulum sp.]MDP3860085.1 hypothetical protein [Phaeovulum sp.]
MASPKSFEDILKMDFRWPRHGDTAFVIADNPDDNANIASCEFSRLVLMVDGYKRGADLMVAETMQDWRWRDLLVYPIIFNYRHFLELSLKYLLATYGRSVGIDPIWNEHNLTKLWCKFCKLLSA